MPCDNFFVHTHYDPFPSECDAIYNNIKPHAPSPTLNKKDGMSHDFIPYVRCLKVQMSTNATYQTSRRKCGQKVRIPNFGITSNETCRIGMLM